MSSAIREIEIKNTIRHHPTCIGRAKSTAFNSQEDVGKLKSRIHGWWECKMVSQKNGLAVSYQTKQETIR